MAGAKRSPLLARPLLGLGVVTQLAFITGTLAFPASFESVCHSYCTTYTPKEEGAQVEGVFRLYQTPMGVWAGMDLLIQDTESPPDPAETIPTHVHTGACSYDINQTPGKLLLSNGEPLVVDAPDDPENHRFREATGFEGSLPPVGDPNVKSHVVHNPDGSSHACCEFQICAPPQDAVCNGFASAWTVSPALATAVEGMVSLSSFEGQSWMFMDVEITGAYPAAPAGGDSTDGSNPPAAGMGYRDDPLLEERLVVALVEDLSSLNVVSAIQTDLPVTRVRTRIGDQKFPAPVPQSVTSYLIVIKNGADQVVASAPVKTCPKFVEVEYTDGADPKGIDEDGGGGGGGVNYGAIIGGLVAVVVVAALLIVFLLWRKRKHDSAAQAAHQAELGDPMKAQPYGHPSMQQGYYHKGSMPSGGYDGQSVYHESRPLAPPTQSSAAGLQAPPSFGGYQPYASPMMAQYPSAQVKTFATEWTETYHTHVPIGVPGSRTHGSRASRSSRPPTEVDRTYATNDTGFNEDALFDALDDMHRSGHLLLGSYRVNSGKDSRSGGQAAVRFLTDAATGDGYVVKFFESRTAFMREAELYEREDLRALVPALRRVEPNKFGDIVAPNGHVFPPFLIVERGEVLDEWAMRRHPDVGQTVSMLTHLAEKLVQLHALGIAHRDLKPPNILWRTKVNEWTLIDYGCAGMIGDIVPVSFTLRYAAPEVLEAYQAQQTECVATAKHDMWSLGVITFEIFTKRRLWTESGVRPNDIMDQIMGKAPAPWEPGHPEHDERFSHLRMTAKLRRVLLSMLDRDPEGRPTAAELLQTLNSLYSETISSE